MAKAARDWMRKKTRMQCGENETFSNQTKDLEVLMGKKNREKGREVIGEGGNLEGCNVGGRRQCGMTKLL